MQEIKAFDKIQHHSWFLRNISQQSKNIRGPPQPDERHIQRKVELTAYLKATKFLQPKNKATHDSYSKSHQRS